MIPHKQYKKIVELMPVLTVDLVLKHKNKYVLVKRKREPMKDYYWTPGGRVHKGETVWKAAKRIIKEEVGIKTGDFFVIGFYDDYFKKSHFGCPTHTVSIVFETTIDDICIKLDHQSSDWKLAKKLPGRFVKKLYRHK